MRSLLDTHFDQAPTEGSVCQVMLTPAQLGHICNLQDEANTVMSSSSWRESTDDTLWYYRAINNELGECSTHVGIKWWKNEHPTEELATSAYQQARMEVIDILHFALSTFVRGAYYCNVPLESKLDYVPTYPKLLPIGRFSTYRQGNTLVTPTYEGVTVNDFIEQCQYVTLEKGQLPLNYVMVLAELLGLTSEDLYIAYVGKNVLNKFRTSKGQRDGSYLKVWNGIEDNEYLTEHLKVALSTGSTPNVPALITKLDTQYQTFLTQGLCTRG